MLKFFKTQIFILFFVVVGFLLMGKIVAAESLDLIKDGKVVAGAIATYEVTYSEDINKRLFRATVIINQALMGISGDELSEERFNAFTKRIHLLIDEGLKGSDYLFRLEKKSDGQELRMIGKTVDSVEKAMTDFLMQYLKLSSEEVQSLETYVDQVMSMQDQETEITISAPAFQKLENLQYE